jgi:hypothetical protein
MPSRGLKDAVSLHVSSGAAKSLPVKTFNPTSRSAPVVAKAKPTASAEGTPAKKAAPKKMKKAGSLSHRLRSAQLTRISIPSARLNWWLSAESLARYGTCLF